MQILCLIWPKVSEFESGSTVFDSVSTASCNTLESPDIKDAVCVLVRLLKTMIKQFARTKFEDEFDKFEEAAEKFQTIPLHFMTYNGPQTIKDVIHTMRQV